ncbi:MAG: hypothetical protein Ct9H300mP28_11530 [Pseudomonadota bacterium]|nr:MAG: hypothetical protein Ct9H300mP28_11530 [Pseudomonadota bacterium]
MHNWVGLEAGISEWELGQLWLLRTFDLIKHGKGGMPPCRISVLTLSLLLPRA